MTETCFAGIRLEIRVMEDSMYAEKWAKEEVPNNVYSFKFAVFPDCPGYPQGLVEASDKGQWTIQIGGLILRVRDLKKIGSSVVDFSLKLKLFKRNKYELTKLYYMMKNSFS